MWGGVGWGTQLLDQVWRQVKKYVPDSLATREGLGQRDSKRVDQYVRSFSFGGTTEEICLRRWPERCRKCNYRKYTCKARVRQKRVHFLLFPNRNSTLQVLTLVKTGMKAHMTQTLPNEKK